MVFDCERRPMGHAVRFQEMLRWGAGLPLFHPVGVMPLRASGWIMVAGKMRERCHGVKIPPTNLQSGFAGQAEAFAGKLADGLDGARTTNGARTTTGGMSA
jgi:hypothetical protein